MRFGVKDQIITDVYPNPAKDIINIVTTATAANPANLIITDMSGRLMLTKQIATAGLSNINISNFAPGLYLLSAIMNDGSKQQFKIIKQ